MGIIVDARDQVIIISFSSFVLSFFIFFNKLFATKGFFFSERVTASSYFFCKDEERNSIFSPIYYGDEESNYHYIYSFFYFFFQVQDNPKGLWVFFYQLGPSLHHLHVDGLQGS
ncbi:hypothetical protein QVD17_12729 [Tagetes erecta]|uniref:Uncharacterized protein n=1 Tax=Tagetes erecta TaxID=13708 RepID=A0AAD8P2W6_TARER|nr:hypothetical protein QVD17_12729 [Tagetes erecta]